MYYIVYKDKNNIYVYICIYDCEGSNTTLGPYFECNKKSATKHHFRAPTTNSAQLATSPSHSTSCFLKGSRAR